MQSTSLARLSAGARAALILALALSLLGAVPAQARANLAGGPATWYVATTGLDTNSCAAFDAPCATINGAQGKAAVGDIINVGTGIYTGSGTEVVLVIKDITLLGGWDETFSAQTGLSTVDGEQARRGVVINGGVTAIIDHFAIQQGSASDGAGIYNQGILNLTNSTVSNNITPGWGGGIFGYYGSSMSLSGSLITGNQAWLGGGIVNAGAMTVTDTTVRNNIAGQAGLSSGRGGAGIVSVSGTVTLNNTTVSGNLILGMLPGSGIDAFSSTVVLNNSTVSGNTGGYQAIYTQDSSLTLNNSTVTKNISGIYNVSGTTTLRNSILAGNTGYDCSGTVTSAGYNLIGRKTADCSFIGITGDKVGTPASPIGPLLTPLADHGGSTLTHALMAGSPALDAGDPATPGSDADACLVTDQRAVARPVDTACDMGAFEGHVAGVVSITRLDPSPTSAASVRFRVTFSEPVTGVDTAAPFADFSLTKTGITGGSIASVGGSGSLYTVTVKTGSNNGTLRLNVVDNDSILDGSSNPLGGPGLGNGSYPFGQVYTIRKIPTAIAPAASAWDQTPAYKWSKVPGATQYAFQAWKGTKLVYSKSVPASACGATVCLNSPANILPPAVYKWRARAMTQGTWKPFSPFKGFTILGAKAGYWRGSAYDFYVTLSHTYVKNFSIYISVNGCGNYKVTNTNLVPIVNGRFKFTGAYYASGTFSTTTAASGLLGLNSYYIPGCGYVSGGPFSWSASWLNPSQPDAMMGAQPLLAVPELDAPSFGPFTVDPAP